MCINYDVLVTSIQLQHEEGGNSTHILWPRAEGESASALFAHIWCWCIKMGCLWLVHRLLQLLIVPVSVAQSPVIVAKSPIRFAQSPVSLFAQLHTGTHTYCTYTVYMSLCRISAAGRKKGLACQTSDRHALYQWRPTESRRPASLLIRKLLSTLCLVLSILTQVMVSEWCQCL